MRCRSCNSLLNDYESARKDRFGNAFVDLCSPCLRLSNEYLSDTWADVDVKVDTYKEDVYNLSESLMLPYDEDTM